MMLLLRLELDMSDVPGQTVRKTVQNTAAVMDPQLQSVKPLVVAETGSMELPAQILMA